MGEAWQEFLDGLVSVRDPDRYVHEAAAAHARSPNPGISVFEYAWDPEEHTARLSFRVVAADGPSPLAADAVPARRADLRAIIADAQTFLPIDEFAAHYVRGGVA